MYKYGYINTIIHMELYYYIAASHINYYNYICTAILYEYNYIKHCSYHYIIDKVMQNNIYNTP